MAEGLDLAQMATLLDFSAKDTIELAAQFGQLLFGCAAVVIAGYWAAHYAGYKPRKAVKKVPLARSTPLKEVPTVTVLEPWESAILHTQGARECQEAAYELAGSAEYLWGLARADLEALNVALPAKRPAPVAPARRIPSSLAA